MINDLKNIIFWSPCTCSHCIPFEVSNKHYFPNKYQKMFPRLVRNVIIVFPRVVKQAYYQCGFFLIYIQVNFNFRQCPNEYSFFPRVAVALLPLFPLLIFCKKKLYAPARSYVLFSSCAVLFFYCPIFSCTIFIKQILLLYFHNIHSPAVSYFSNIVRKKEHGKCVRVSHSIVFFSISLFSIEMTKDMANALHRGPYIYTMIQKVCMTNLSVMEQPFLRSILTHIGRNPTKQFQIIIENQDHYSK